MTRACICAIPLLALLALGACRSRAQPADMRPRIEEAIRTEVEPLRNRSEVAAYLERLHARARAQRAVTALEVEPGVAAITRLTPELGDEATQEWVAAFVHSMSDLSHDHRREVETR